MRTLLKVLAIAVCVVLALAAAGLGWLAVRKPAQRPPSTEKIEATPERLARGKYLVDHVTGCLDCHSDHAPGYGLPIKPALLET